MRKEKERGPPVTVYSCGKLFWQWGGAGKGVEQPEHERRVG